MTSFVTINVLLLMIFIYRIADRTLRYTQINIGSWSNIIYPFVNRFINYQETFIFYESCETIQQTNKIHGSSVIEVLKILSSSFSRLDTHKHTYMYVYVVPLCTYIDGLSKSLTDEWIYVYMYRRACFRTKENRKRKSVLAFC